jgi:hypothetical protein
MSKQEHFLWTTEVRVVEEVEHFGAELNANPVRRMKLSN